MPEYTQDNRLIAVDTPLGKDVLLLIGFSGREEMSKLFHYTLDMVSETLDIDPVKIVGQPVGFRFTGPEDGSDRYFHGIVSRFSAGVTEEFEVPLRRYRAEVVPRLWFLTLNADCRIFQEKTIPDIITQVLKDRGLTDHQSKVSGTYAKLDYCVQYRETDFQFISRLMEWAGFYYYFSHEEAKHTLVWGDGAQGYAKCEEASVEYLSGFDGQVWGRVDSWEQQFELTSGKYTQTDYNFEEPTGDLTTSEKTIVKLKGAADFEVFDYPGGYGKAADGKKLAMARIEQLEVPHNVVTGTSSCVSFSPGAKFKLKEHPVDAEKNKSYVLTVVEHKAHEPGGFDFLLAPGEDSPDVYSNRFECLPDKTIFRPARTTPRPMIYGPQTAKVVGAKDQEIHTDKYGRIRVQFHWDREGKFDDKSSCWMRVAQRWAGQEWGMLYTPRVGQEVMVEFLDGDPDRPIVTGSVYNADQMPPYKLPDDAKQSGIKTRSTDKGNAAKFNELRFDDAKDKEHIYFHAQKDFARVVENVDSLEIGYDKMAGDLPLEGDKGDQVIKVLNNRTITVEKGDTKLEVLEKDHIIDVAKGNQLITIKTDQKISTDTTTIEAKQKIVFKVGSNSITIDMKGVAVVGTQIAIEGKAKAELKAPMTNVKGDAMLKLEGGMIMIN